MEKEYFIDVTRIKEGICLLCSERCDQKAVMHYQCALMYNEFKKNNELFNKIKEELNKKNGRKKTVKTRD